MCSCHFVLISDTPSACNISTFCVRPCPPNPNRGFPCVDRGCPYIQGDSTTDCEAGSVFPCVNPSGSPRSMHMFPRFITNINPIGRRKKVLHIDTGISVWKKRSRSSTCLGAQVLAGSCKKCRLRLLLIPTASLTGIDGGYIVRGIMQIKFTNFYCKREMTVPCMWADQKLRRSVTATLGQIQC